MTQVDILIEGYLSNESGGRTCPTITLVRDENLNIIVDPGTAQKPQLIIDALAKHSLAPEDINIVFLTHSHYDHFRNITLFPNAKCRDYWGLWDNDFNQDASENLTQNIRIIKTPGHSYDGLTMLVKTGSSTTAICGDVWFKENFPKTDRYAQSHEALINSRKIIEKEAGYVIPGHGKMFKLVKGEK